MQALGQGTVMQALARWISRRHVSVAIVVVVLLTSAAASYLALGVQRDDDMLAFLPANDPDVVHFRELAARFGGLEVALVGIDTGSPDGIYRRDFLARLGRTTEALKVLREVESALSFANVADYVVDKQGGGLVTGPLMLHLPQSPEQERALRAKALARSHVRGQLVALDGRSAVIYCFLSHGADLRRAADQIRAEVGKELSAFRLYWGGNPFVSSYIFGSVQRDLRRLMPWAVLAMVAVMLLAFRDMLGTCLALFSTGCAIAITVALMVLFKEPMNLVLGSMPLILFSVGSAYGIHVLARYYRATSRGATDGRAAALALASAGPTVLVAGVTTALSLFSFISMDLRPMRAFGLFAGIGVLIALGLALVFVPAVLNLLAPRRSLQVEGRLSRLLVVPFVRLIATRRGWALAAIALLLGLAGVAISRIQNRIDSTNFFRTGSEPALAETFLAQHFGGSQFIQVAFSGDLNQPAVLRELVALGDQLALLPEVSAVSHLGQVVAQANEAMEGQRRIPDSSAKLKTLYTLMDGEAGLGQLVARDRRHALINVKLAVSDARALDQVLETVEALVGGTALTQRLALAAVSSPTARRRQAMLLMRHLAAGWRERGLVLEPATRARGEQVLTSGALRLQAGDPERVAKRLRRFIASDECAAELPKSLPQGGDPLPPLVAALKTLTLPPLAGLARSAWRRELRRRVGAVFGSEPGRVANASQAVANAGPAGAAQKRPAAPRAAGIAALVEDVVLSLGAPLEGILADEAARSTAQRLFSAAGISLPSDGRRGELRSLTQATLLGLRSSEVLVPTPSGATRLQLRVNGMPTIHRALARSALRNQVRSLAWALAPVLLVVAFVFRSWVAGLVVSAPTVLTLVCVFGGMGAAGVRLDIGTAMLACIIVGAGVDYGVHFLAAWRSGPLASNVNTVTAATEAACYTGGAICTNALTVGAGFFVLTLGEARPLHNVGLLTSVAMLGAALATFLAIPALARRGSYGPLGMNDPLEFDVSAGALPATTAPLAVDAVGEAKALDR